MNSSRLVLVNLMGFQAGWFACILGAARGSAWLGPAVVLLLAVFQLRWCGVWRSRAALMGAGALLGLGVDTVLGASGALSFAATPFPAWVSPPWMMALWVNFSLSLTLSLRWLLERYRLASLLGLVGGPMAYLAGAKLNALQLGDSRTASLLLVAVLWGAALPALLKVAGRLGHDPLGG